MGRNRIGMAATAAIAVLLLGSTAMSAFAQDTDEVEPAPAAAGEGDHTTRFEQRREEHEAAFSAALAEELDLPVEQVRAAVAKVHDEMRAEREAERKAAFKARLDAAVADGTLTREQADAILAAAEAGVLPMGPGEHRQMRRQHGPRAGAHGQASAGTSA